MDIIQQIQMEDKLVLSCKGDKQLVELILARIEERARKDAKIIFQMLPELLREKNV